ncbi:MAG TPA: hypothetical protein PLW68_12770 [Casimicrobiaceae bacterium]|nr:hypothetical protein [Casimicrobiaceae bacterium]
MNTGLAAAVHTRETHAWIPRRSALSGLASAALFLLGFTAPALAVQTVTPVQNAAGATFTPNGANSWAVTRAAGQTLVLYGRYSSSQSNESGMGLRIQYDETRFTGVVIDQVMNKCLAAAPQIQTIAAGNSQAVLAWADLSVRRTSSVPNGSVGWTGTADPAAPSSSSLPTDGCLDITTFGAGGPQLTGAVALPANLFRLTATLAAGFTSGTSAITFTATSASQATCVPGPGAPCFTDQTLVVTGAATPPLTLQFVVSRKVHGTAGTFDLLLGAVPTDPTTEPRAGPTHTLVFAFDQPVVSGVATVSEGTAAVGTPTFNGSEMTVPLTGVTNPQYVTVNVSNVAASGGAAGGNGSIRVGYNFGDANQSRQVTVADVGIVNAALLQTVTNANFLLDINVDGRLTVADKGLANANLLKKLPAP